MAFQNLNDIRNLKLWKFFLLPETCVQKKPRKMCVHKKLYYNKTYTALCDIICPKWKENIICPRIH